MVVLRLFEVQGSDFVLLPEFHTSEQVASLQADGQLAFEESLLQSNVGGVERKKFHRPLVATTVKVDIGRDHIIVRKAQDLAQNTVERGSVMSHLSAQIFTLKKGWSRPTVSEGDQMPKFFCTLMKKLRFWI